MASYKQRFTNAVDGFILFCRSSSDNESIEEILSTNGRAHVLDVNSVEDGEFRTAYCADADAALVPNTDLSGITAADIIQWDDFISSNAKTLTLMCETSLQDASLDNNHLGWWVTINAGSPVIAKDRMREALDTATGIEIARYVAAATVDADENKVSLILPPKMPLQITSTVPITDIYVMPVASVATVTGNSLLTAVIS